MRVPLKKLKENQIYFCHRAYRNKKFCVKFLYKIGDYDEHKSFHSYVFQAPDGKEYFKPPKVKCSFRTATKEQKKEFKKSVEQHQVEEGI